jgi:hypothetical protein
MTRAQTDSERAVELTERINGLHKLITGLAAERAQVYMRLQRAGWSTRAIGRLVGTSQVAVVHAMKGARFAAPGTDPQETE